MPMAVPRASIRKRLNDSKNASVTSCTSFGTGCAAGSAKDSELEEPDACGVGGDLEAGPSRLDQGEAVRIALAGHAEKTMRFEIGSGQLTDLAGGHKERAADIASLPLHPVGLGRVENVVAIADLHARIRVAFQQVRARRLQIPQIGVESDMSVFMGECRAQAVLPVLIPGQGSRDPHTRFPAGLEMGEPLDIAAIAGQVCELVEGLGVALNENRQVIGRNGILRGAMPFLEEAGDDVLAFAVEFLGLVMRTLREPARAVRNVFNHQLQPLPFRGPPRRPPRKPTIASATCFSESFLLRTSSGKRPAR